MLCILWRNYEFAMRFLEVPGTWTKGEYIYKEFELYCLKGSISVRESTPTFEDSLECPSR